MISTASHHTGYNHGAPVTLTESKTYDISGNVLTTKDAKGNLTTYVYDAQNRCIKTIDALGGTTLSTYDRAGRKTAEILPNSYDPEKSLNQMVRTEYLYGNMDQVIAVTLKYEKLTYDDISGVWLRTWTETVTKAFKYDNSLRVIKELSGEGYAAGTGTTVQDKITNGYGTETTYNLAGLPLTIRDAATKVAGLVATLNYTYDAQGRKVTETNAKNHIISYTYDDAGNLIQVSLNGTVQKSSTYDLANRLITSRDGNNNTTQFMYNKLGKIKEVIYPGDASIDANTSLYFYDTMGNLVYDVNSMGKKTLSTFDALGRPTSVTVKDGEDHTLQNKAVVYDVLGNVRFETDPNGQVTETTYDALSRPVTKSTAVGGNVKVTNYTYDANSNPLTTTNWLGNTSELVYDALNRVVGKRDAHGKIVETLVYDLNNAQISSVDALGQETIYKYDVNGRRIETQDAEGNVTKVDYDVLGNVIGETDGIGNKKRYEYDAAARLTAVVSALGEKTLYTYDVVGNMLTQTDGNGNTTAFTYNAMNKLEKRMDPLSAGEMPRIESMTYYADGSVKSKVDRNGQSTLYSYDALGRMLSQTVGSTSISYTYDSVGNTLTMIDQTGMTTWTYDAQGRALTKTMPHIGTSTYDYDLVTGIAGLGAGDYAERTTDPKGNVTLKIYDKMDRVISVDDGSGVTRFTYYDNGSRQSVIYPDGSSETYVYDANNQNTALVNRKADNSLIDTYSYTYDAANNQTSKTDSKGTTTFEYDKLSRISTVTEPSGIKTVYAYDKAGNRISEKKVVGEAMTQETVYKYDASNRLLTTETKSQVLGTNDKVTYTYDANGNMLSQKTTNIKPAEIGGQATFVLEKSGASPNTLTQYAYDVFNQLKTSDDGTHKISYAYNGIGYRVEKSVTTGPKESPVTSTSRYLYEYDKVVLEVDGAGNKIAKNTYGTNLLSREMADSTVYYMYNGHGDVTALLNTAGDIVATYYYDIWGNIVEKMESALVSNPFRYAGYQYDEETGLYYLNARYYDAKIARFLTEDTYRGRQNDPLSLNVYTYCLNNPIKYSDPTGHIAAALYEADGNVRTNVAAGTAKNQSVSSTNTNNSQITNDSTKNKYEAEKERAAREKAARDKAEKDRLQREKEAKEKADRDKRAKESNEILKNQEKNKPKNNVKPALNNITSLTTGSMGAGCSVSVVREGKSYDVYYTADNFKSRETALNVGLYTSMAAGLGVAAGIAGGVVVVAETISASALLPDAQLDMNSFTTNVAAGNIAGAYVDAIALMIPGVSAGGMSGKIDDFVGVGTGTNKVWDSIKATQPVYDGTVLPKSFEISVNNQKMWVHANGTKHIYEEVAKQMKVPGIDPKYYTQLLLDDFSGTLQQATKNGIKYDELMTVGKWEFKFSTPRGEGLFPVVKHAQFNGWGN